MDYRQRDALRSLAASVQEAGRTIDTVLGWDHSQASTDHILGAVRVAHADLVAIEQLTRDMASCCDTSDCSGLMTEVRKAAAPQHR